MEPRIHLALRTMVLTSLALHLLACDEEPRCEGSLVLDGDFIAAVPEDLESIAHYSRIAGDLTITGNVRNVGELGCLETIDGLLYLSQGELDDLVGLTNIQEIGGLYISQMPRLESLRGLESVRSLSSLTVQLAGVRDFLGLTGLERITGRLHLHEGLFADMRGLENLESVGGALNINGFAIPLSLDGLSRLQSIGGSFDVQLNGGLTSMRGLSQLESVGGELRVVDNPALLDLLLPELRSLGGSLSIRSNSSLPNCHAVAIRDQLIDAGWVGEAAIGSNSSVPCD